MPITKKTSKNQITLPRSVLERFPDVEYFDVREEDGTIVLRAVRPGAADAARKKLAKLGIGEEDVEAAIRWARER